MVLLPIYCSSKILSISCCIS